MFLVQLLTFIHFILSDRIRVWGSTSNERTTRPTAINTFTLMQKGDHAVKDYGKSLFARTKDGDEVIKGCGNLDHKLFSHKSKNWMKCPQNREFYFTASWLESKMYFWTKGKFNFVLRM